MNLKILELFSGYGTSTFALKELKIKHQVIGYSDIDKYANQIFKQNHLPNDEQNHKRLGDVKQIDPNQLKDFDILTAGFPCQAFSTAGNMKGELDTRGTLFYEIIRIAENKKPKYMLLENVKGLTYKKFRETFKKILSELQRIGYKVYFEVLNSKEHGIPQNRERIWFVCIRNDIKQEFQFPKKTELKIFLKDILEEEVNKKYYLSEKQLNNLKKYLGKKNNSNKEVLKILNKTHPYPPDFNNNSLMIGNITRYKMKSERSIKNSDKGVSWCLNSNNNVGVMECNILDVYNNKLKKDISITLTDPKHNNLRLIEDRYIRKLTPKECFRLMGFLKDQIKLDGISDTQKYKLAGNGQDLNVVKLIYKDLLKDYLPK